MSVREVILEWRRGCSNTAVSDLPFWRCGYCTWHALRAMLRATIRGEF